MKIKLLIAMIYGASTTYCGSDKASDLKPNENQSIQATKLVVNEGRTIGGITGHNTSYEPRSSSGDQCGALVINEGRTIGGIIGCSSDK